MTTFQLHKAQVIQFDYLWSDERESGQPNATKGRACLVMATRTDSMGKSQLIVLPLSTKPWHKEQGAVSMPHPVLRKLGLSTTDESFIVVKECNRFIMPNENVLVVPGKKPVTPVYGAVPLPVFNMARAKYLEQHELGALVVVDRPTTFDDDPGFRKGRWKPEVR